jgi:ribonuclease J
VAGPDIVNRGFVYEDTSADILEEGRKRVMLALTQSAAEAHVTDPSVLQQSVRRVLGKYFYEVTQRKPVILPVIMEV